jgi:predicted TPR repeat methyltransferase
MNKSSNPKGPSEFVSEAYNLSDDEKIVDFYSKWADEYDHQMLDVLGYTSPKTVAQLLCDYLPDKNSRIFDIGCGTGLTCIFLHQQGYDRLDGVDLSPDMVRVAQDRNIYQQVSVADLNQPLAIDDNSYDAAISSGTFTHGHVGPEPLDEIFRIIRPGGILACTVHNDLWKSDGFAIKFESLEKTGSIECLSLVEGKYYEAGEPEGRFCVYRKI